MTAVFGMDEVGDRETTPSTGMRATPEDIEAAVELMAAAGISDVERYRRQLTWWAQYWDGGYLAEVARWLAPIAVKWEAT